MICLQQMLQIQLAPLVLGVLVLGTMVFLCFSAGFTLAFNARIGREEGPPVGGYRLQSRVRNDIIIWGRIGPPRRN